jgi:hypothetical protein
MGKDFGADTLAAQFGRSAAVKLQPTWANRDFR